MRADIKLLTATEELSANKDIEQVVDVLPSPGLRDGALIDTDADEGALLAAGATRSQAQRAAFARPRRLLVQYVLARMEVEFGMLFWKCLRTLPDLGTASQHHPAAPLGVFLGWIVSTFRCFGSTVSLVCEPFRWAGGGVARVFRAVFALIAFCTVVRGKASCTTQRKLSALYPVQPCTMSARRSEANSANRSQLVLVVALFIVLVVEAMGPLVYTIWATGLVLVYALDLLVQARTPWLSVYCLSTVSTACLASMCTPM